MITYPYFFKIIFIEVVKKELLNFEFSVGVFRVTFMLATIHNKSNNFFYLIFSIRL